MIKSEMGLVWSDKFKRKSIFLERGTAGNKIAWHKRWIGSTVLGGSDLGANVWHAKFKSGIEYAHAANRAGNSKDEMFFRNLWFFNHDWGKLWFRLLFHGGH